MIFEHPRIACFQDLVLELNARAFQVPEYVEMLRNIENSEEFFDYYVWMDETSSWTIGRVIQGKGYCCFEVDGIHWGCISRFLVQKTNAKGQGFLSFSPSKFKSLVGHDLMFRVAQKIYEEIREICVHRDHLEFGSPEFIAAGHVTKELVSGSWNLILEYLRTESFWEESELESCTDRMRLESIDLREFIKQNTQSPEDELRILINSLTGTEKGWIHDSFSMEEPGRKRLRSLKSRSKEKHEKVMKISEFIRTNDLVSHFQEVYRRS